MKKAPKKKNPGAVALGKAGAVARMTKMTAEQRSAVAQNAAIARWGSAAGAKKRAGAKKKKAKK